MGKTDTAETIERKLTLTEQVNKIDAAANAQKRTAILRKAVDDNLKAREKDRWKTPCETN